MAGEIMSLRRRRIKSKSVEMLLAVFKQSVMSNEMVIAILPILLTVSIQHYVRIKDMVLPSFKLATRGIFGVSVLP